MIQISKFFIRHSIAYSNAPFVSVRAVVISVRLTEKCTRIMANLSIRTTGFGIPIAQLIPLRLLIDEGTEKECD